VLVASSTFSIISRASFFDGFLFIPSVPFSFSFSSFRPLPAALPHKKHPTARGNSGRAYCRTKSNVLSRNWRHNTLNTNELYQKRLYYLRVEVIKRQFLAQVTEPQALVNASYNDLRYSTRSAFSSCVRASPNVVS
jgi:hypothetical protein